MLLKSLMVIGAILGLAIATIGISVPWLLPKLFTPDLNVIQEVSSQVLNLIVSIFVTIFKSLLSYLNDWCCSTIDSGSTFLYCLVLWLSF